MLFFAFEIQIYIQHTIEAIKKREKTSVQMDHSVDSTYDLL